MNGYLTEFLNYLASERHYSDLTIINYDKDLNLFLLFLKESGITSFKRVEYQHIRSYISFMHSKKYRPKTINRHISTLRSFFNYLINNKIVSDNPLLLVSNVKESKRIPNFLFYNDLEKLFAVSDLTTTLGQRDILVIEMLYSTGIRVSELVNIRLNDINKQDKSIRIKGKGSKERDVLYGHRCKELLDIYLNDAYLKLNKNNIPFIFLNNNGNKISTRGISIILDNIVRKSGLSFKVTPHMLRHTFATHMLNEGADLLSVKQLLGHENLSTTQVYTHVSNERLRNVYLNSHPRAKKGV